MKSCSQSLTAHQKENEKTHQGAWCPRSDRGMRGTFGRMVSACTAICLGLCIPSCERPKQTPQPKREDDQDLRITFGGFREGHPDEGKLEGVCSPDRTRSILDCDIYNGLEGWAVTEITLVVTWAPPSEDNKRLYMERVSIQPQTTERLTIRLGMQLPEDTPGLKFHGGRLGPAQSHWGWLITSAKGHALQ